MNNSIRRLDPAEEPKVDDKDFPKFDPFPELREEDDFDKS